MVIVSLLPEEEEEEDKELWKKKWDYFSFGKIEAIKKNEDSSFPKISGECVPFTYCSIFGGNHFFFIVMSDDHEGKNRNYFKKNLAKKIQERIQKLRNGININKDDNIKNNVSVCVFFVSDKNEKSFVEIIENKINFIGGEKVKLLTFRYDDFFSFLSYDKLKLLKEKIKDLQCNEPGELLDKFEKITMDIFSENGDGLSENSRLLESENNDNKYFFWIGLLFPFFLIAAIIIYFFVFRQKKEKDEESSNEIVE